MHESLLQLTHGEVFAIVASKNSRSRCELVMSVYKHLHQISAPVFILTWTITLSSNCEWLTSKDFHQS